MRMVSRKACLSTMLVLTFFLAIVYLNRIEERLPQVQTVQTIPLLADSLHTLQHHQSSHLFSARRSLSKEPSHSVHRYILSLSYWEQLTMGVRNLFSVACFGSLWNMTVVQPFTYNSRLYGLPNLKPDHNMNSTRRAEDLDLIFNTKSLNNALGHYNIPKLSLLKTFLEKAPREVTVIHFVAYKEVHELPVLTKGKVGHNIQAAFERSNVVDCKALLPDYDHLITQHLNNEVTRLGLVSYPNFKIVKYFCVNMSVLTTPESLASNIRLRPSDHNETVVIVNWRGIATQSVLLNTAKGAHINNRIAINSTCRDRRLSVRQSLIQYSSLVLKTTELFLKKSRLSGVEYAAVHIRSEKMGLREPRFPGSFKDCLRKLKQAIHTISVSKPNVTFVYITDYGPYSSDTCKHCKSGERVLDWLKRRGDHQLQFDPLQYDLPVDNGLAAAIEANVLASARYLLVCGGGAFQKQVTTRFLRKQRAGNSLFKVCTEDSDLLG